MSILTSKKKLKRKVQNLNVNSEILGEEFSSVLESFNISGKVAIACSGGIDSLCLAFLAAKNLDIIALIIDHGLREESSSEAEIAAETLTNLGIENHILYEDRSITTNIQAEARKLRYDLLTQYCKENGIKTLAIAQHAEDNAETVLLKLSRGSGVDGLSGILPETELENIKIIRPLLGFSKGRLKATLQANNIEWVEDPTNKTDKYKRNKLRHVLEGIEDPELVISRLNDTAENMRRVRDFLESETQKALSECLREDKLDIEKFKKLHDEIAYRVLVKIVMEKTDAEQRPRFEKIKSLKNAILNKEVKTLAGLIFRPQNEDIIITLEKEA